MPTNDVDHWVRAEDALPMLANVRSFVSGDGLPRLRAEFLFHAAERRVRGQVWFGPGAEGMPEYVHGAAIAGVIDEGLGLLAWYLGSPVATKTLNIQYLRFIPAPSHVWLEGQLEDELGGLIRGRAALQDHSGAEFAMGKATFIELEAEVVEELTRRHHARNIQGKTP